MYHERSTKQRRRRRGMRLAALALVLALAVGGWFAAGAVGQNLREQGAVSVRNAILDSAKQCCAIEGSYPSSLEHLEQSYGLRVNRGDYVITYEVFAENIMPSVVVVPR
ncbi:MAG: hypothetical protein KH158_07445 [Eggerthellaceae bacterium]|uniref:Uncharacterized protein n=2 Tax=Eggerthellaceae TaxID=1643826 RepID=A0A1Y4G477_9ACTN|nr:hypothetical protein [Eggerthellaceae bacterium]MSA93879.1 hypothetical protein [Gordonibacter urolithinfaciens]MVM53642.1 hypothetical protein [Gordonibacter urolithinfaciens]MVN14148.1 hypothetical protein [Gordonibacter urolithinfaciens]MVN37483.1 hypothetical protein [Gordonibacter urolithinfaciens]